MDHGFAEVRLAANSGAVTKGERSHASCLPSREKAGAESLSVEAAGKGEHVRAQIEECEETVFALAGYRAC